MDVNEEMDAAAIGAATSRSSAKRVSSVVSKFDRLKRKLVTDIGFSGILHMPQINMTPRKFTVWILSKVDLESRSIMMDGRPPVALDDKSFARVLGIPCGPKKLFGLDCKVAQDKTDFIKLALGSLGTDPSETCSVKVAEQVVAMEYPHGMNKDECDRFKVSFVVFVIGHFLVAKARSNHGVDDYWGSLMNTDEINQYNFCSLVIDELLDSARRVQSELRSSRPVKNVTGCTLGLQVLYLDSLNLPGFHLDPEKTPRISLFDLTLLKRMIHEDDSNNIFYFSSSDTSSHVLTKAVKKPTILTIAPVRDKETAPSVKTVKDNVYSTPQPAVSSYLTAYLRGNIDKKLTNAQVDDLKWHNARMIQHVRKTKEFLRGGGEFNLDVAGLKSVVEVQMESLMSKIFQDNLALAQRLHTHCSKDPSVSSSATNLSSYRTRSSSFYCQGSGSISAGSGNSSVGCGSASGSVKLSACAAAAACVTPLVGKQLFTGSTNSCNKRIKLEKDVDVVGDDVNNSSVKGKFRQFILGEDAITDIVERASCSSNNIKCIQKHNSSMTRLFCRHKRMASDPWKYGRKSRCVSDKMTSGFYIWLQNNNLSTLLCYWIEHSLPKYIQLNGYDLKDIFIKRHDFTSDAFDVAVRRICQLDFNMYGPGNKISWRHILESDFADVVLSGVDPLSTVSVILQFTSCFYDYDISECRMIVIPASQGGGWCCYYFDMEFMKIHIIDPAYDPKKQIESQECHLVNIEKLKRGLSCAISVLYEGWSVDWEEFKPNFLNPIIPNSPRSDSGLLTLLAIQEFDGFKFVEDQTEESVTQFSKLVLYEMLSIEENYGKLPSAFVQYVN